MSNYKTAEHTNRPLTEEERRFAEEHHNLMYRYMKIHELDPEEWYDILIIPYLNAVKKFHQYEKLQSLKFEQVFFRTLDNARSNYFRDMNRLKRKPSGGIFSYDALIDDDSDRNSFEYFLIDSYASVERQVIFEECFKEFYRAVTTDTFDYIVEHDKWLLDLFLQGYEMKEVKKLYEKKYGKRGINTVDYIEDILDGRIRKCFKNAFGI